MYLIVGLGNPEEDYSRTRHNIGFDAINKISKKYNIEVNKKKMKGLYGTGIIENEKVILLKPQTFMNLSGESIIQFLNYYKLNLEDLIIIYDDIDLKVGTIRYRTKGSSGTHNGMKSVISHLKSEEFKRIRIGIDCPEDKSRLIEHVLGNVPEEEKELLEEAVENASKKVIEIIKEEA